MLITKKSQFVFFVIFVAFVIFVTSRRPVSVAHDSQPCSLYQASVRRMPSRSDTDGA